MLSCRLGLSDDGRTGEELRSWPAFAALSVLKIAEIAELQENYYAAAARLAIVSMKMTQCFYTVL